MSFWEEEGQVQKMVIDIGFEKWSSPPLWVFDIANQLIDAGWKKK